MLAVGAADSRAAGEAARAEKAAGWSTEQAWHQHCYFINAAEKGWTEAEARAAGYVDTTPGGGCMRPQKQN